MCITCNILVVLQRTDTGHGGKVGKRCSRNGCFALRLCVFLQKVRGVNNKYLKQKWSRINTIIYLTT